MAKKSGTTTPEEHIDMAAGQMRVGGGAYEAPVEQPVKPATPAVTFVQETPSDSAVDRLSGRTRVPGGAHRG